MNTTIGILGNDFKITTQFVENIINKTRANTDQEHIKMNIVINNYLLNKSDDEISDILCKMKKSNINFIVLTVNDDNLLKLVKNNNIIVINNSFSIDDNNLVKKIINLCGKEYKE